jgi:autotransporter strand-loop-strand O-heptosyltransferase
MDMNVIFSNMYPSKYDKSFLLYGNEHYIPIIQSAINSLRTFTDLPIIVYLLNSDKKLSGKDVDTRKWICPIRNQEEELYNKNGDENYYIDRNRVAIYDTLIQRPNITKDVLTYFSNTVCYLDADSISLPNVEKIFDLYPNDETVPYFTKGVYDFMYWDGVGNSGDDLTKTLENPICELYNIDQTFRFQSGYRQTGYYIAGQNTLPFIDEWIEMCYNPIIKNNTVHYAAYHEETIVNCLLWKHKISKGLPNVYVNGSIETIDLINNKNTFTGEPRHIKDWVVVPSSRDELFFIHGEKRLNIINNMIENLKETKMKVLYLTPHLSTGGMPQFVLKRIQELQKHKDKIEIFLVEFSQFSDEYVVQRNEIIKILGEGHFFNLGFADDKQRKYELMDIIKNNNIDVVHSEEMVEGFEGFNRIPLDLLNQLYSNDRTWRMIETCHNVWFNPETNKKFNPDAYCFVTPHHPLNTFASTSPMNFLITYPYENKVKPLLEKHQIFDNLNKVPMIEKLKVCEELGIDPFKTHILNIGLWTSGKNQSEGVEVARRLVESNPDIQFHFVGNQAPNFEDYWGPVMKNLPSNVKVWGERNDVDKFMRACDVLMFNSTWECNPLVVRESINYGMKIMARDLPQYMGMFDEYIKPIEGDVENIANNLVELINDDKTYEIPNDESFGDDLLSMYTIVMNEPITINEPLKTNYTFITYNINQPYFEIQGQSENNFDFKIYNNDTNQLYYQNTLPINSWVKLNREYFTNWRYEVYENGDLIYNKVLDLKGKRVFIPLSSKSLGDTLAWFPYIDEFRKKHDCHIITSTFMNYLFVDQYPELEFVEPGEVVNNIHAQYNFGWFYDEKGNVDYNKNPNDFRILPLQKTASDILGLDYKEIRPKLNLPNVKKKKKVGIGLHSTAQAKYWNNPNGWQEVINHLNGLGYECMIYSKEGDGYMGNNHPKGVTIYKGGNLQEVIDDLSTCEFFIGLGSGLSWLAWACKLPVVLISGFSEKWAETKLDTFRVINENVCHGCFNKERLDAGDWNWCPLHKGTDRQFECTKQISSEMVINEINNLLNNNPLPKFDWGWMNSGDGLSDFHKSAMYNEIFEQRLYEKFFEVEEGDIVLDIGSSVGPFTYSILHKKPKHVFCVEPSESEFATLIKNTLGHPVTHINKGISNFNGVIEHDQLFGGETHMESITFDKFIKLYGLKRIDFLKTDCEGGEYEMFKIENLPFIKQNVKKIVGEWHLRSPENKVKFRNFRDNILTQFDKYEVYSVDGVDIKWDLWNDHFIEFYREVIFYIDNR